MLSHSWEWQVLSTSRKLQWWGVRAQERVRCWKTLLESKALSSPLTSVVFKFVNLRVLGTFYLVVQASLHGVRWYCNLSTEKQVSFKI